MKVPFNWLKDYVDIDMTAEELGDALTLMLKSLKFVK